MVTILALGETEWTKTGQYTGTTDLELTAEGIKQVTSTASQLVGTGKLIDPARVGRVWVSPRERAQQTLRLLFSPIHSSPHINAEGINDRVVTTEDISEWDYGDYEGLTSCEIKAKREEHGLDKEQPWNIWRDGCEGGEYVTLTFQIGEVLLTFVIDP
jgi:probable phosphoglycerate mutase